LIHASDFVFVKFPESEYSPAVLIVLQESILNDTGGGVGVGLLVSVCVGSGWLFGVEVCCDFGEATGS
jgi:hypothetical protein